MMARVETAAMEGTPFAIGLLVQKVRGPESGIWKAPNKAESIEKVANACVWVHEKGTQDMRTPFKSRCHHSEFVTLGALTFLRLNVCICRMEVAAVTAHPIQGSWKIMCMKTL